MHMQKRGWFNFNDFNILQKINFRLWLFSIIWSQNFSARSIKFLEIAAGEWKNAYKYRRLTILWEALQTSPRAMFLSFWDSLVNSPRRGAISGAFLASVRLHQRRLCPFHWRHRATGAARFRLTVAAFSWWAPRRFWAGRRHLRGLLGRRRMSQFRLFQVILHFLFII